MNGAELLIKCLANEGVRYVFGLPGEENLAVLDALDTSDIRSVITRDERGAAFMANAWGRLAGSPGVCLSTLGPGATNLVTGIADAFLDFSPMLAITAQLPPLRLHKEAHQYIDVLSMLRPITKWNARVESPGTVPEIVRKAFKISVLEKMGPTHIEIAEDVAGAQAEGIPLPPGKTTYPVPPPEHIKKAVALIEESKMPVILAGNGVIRGGASSELLAFARKSGIAVINTFMGMGVVPADDELFVSTIGLQSMDYVLCGINKADLIVTVGYDPAEFSAKYWESDKKIIHININPAEVDASYNAFELLGDIKETLKLVSREAGFQKDPGYFIRLKREIEEDMNDDSYKANDGVSPLTVVLGMRSALNRDDILISDVGAHKIWIARFYPAYMPNTVLISNGFASMGFAIPAAISAKLMYPEKNIVAAVGDGGFLMSAAELETAVRLKVPFVVVIFNDDCYGLIQWKQMLKYKRDFSVRIKNPDFVKLAESFGCKGYRAGTGGELQKALHDALGRPTPAIIDCRVDYSVNIRLTEKLGHIVCKA